MLGEAKDAMSLRKKRIRSEDPPKQIDDMIQELTVDFGHLATTRSIFKTVQEAGGAKSWENWFLSPLAAFESWLIVNYMVTCIIALRRQSETDDDATSLAKLLAALGKNADSMSRTRLKSLYPHDKQEEADRLFDDLIGQGESVLGRKAIKSDKNAFNEKVKLIRKFATARIAHLLDLNPVLRDSSAGSGEDKSHNELPIGDTPHNDLLIDEINECVDLAVAIFQKYLTLAWGLRAPTLARPINAVLVTRLRGTFAPHASSP
jgi:hypothetical protein